MVSVAIDVIKREEVRRGPTKDGLGGSKAYQRLVWRAPPRPVALDAIVALTAVEFHLRHYGFSTE